VVEQGAAGNSLGAESGHELLFPVTWTVRELTSYVRKPFFGREGTGIAVVQNEWPWRAYWRAIALRAASIRRWRRWPRAVARRRSLAPGWWMAKPAGMGIRESKGLSRTTLVALCRTCFDRAIRIVENCRGELIPDVISLWHA